MSSKVNALRTTLSAALVLGAQSVSAQSIEAVWETSADLKGPESAVYDAANDTLYVSNVNGQPNDVDGNGFLSKVDMDGKITELEWVSGLNAPKGMALYEGKLYVSDINTLVEVDTASGEITQRYEAEGAKFLNDVTTDESGTVYVTDMLGNTIFRLNDGVFEAWVSDEALDNPNGILFDNGQLIIGAWGKMTDGFATEVPGHLKTVAMDSGAVSSLGDGKPVGNLDGVVADGKGNYLVTDWLAGKLLRVMPKGEASELLDLGQGSADLTFIAEKNLVLVPRMMNGTLAAYRIGD